MSLESFAGFDSNEPMSAAALEKLQERMRAAAAQMAAARKQEGKQKQKEDELLKILLAFIQNSHKTTLVLLISRCLEKNLPANFILAVILLGNPEIQASTGKFLLLAPTAEQIANPESEKHALTFFGQDDQALPLRQKIELDHWIKNLLDQAGENPEKLLRTAYDLAAPDAKIITAPLIRLTHFILRDYLESHEHDEDEDKLERFAQFILTGILDKITDAPPQQLTV